MDDQQALSIVTALANGANPQTGEIFERDSPYQSPDVIRALYAAQRALEAKLYGARRAGGTARSAGPHHSPSDDATKSNAGKPWSAEEDQQLLKEFDADRPIAEIARAHGRTAAGIRARLEKHGKLEPSGSSRWPHGNRGVENDSTRQPGREQNRQ